MEPQSLAIEVAFATRAQQKVIPLSVPCGTSLAEAIALSNISAFFPDYPWSELGHPSLAVGVFGEKRALTDQVVSGDRIEIYLPLKQSALAARQQRIQAKKAGDLQKN